MDLSAYRRKSSRVIPTSISQLLNSESYIFYILKTLYNHEQEDVEKVEFKKCSSLTGLKGNLSDSSSMRIFVKTSSGDEFSYDWFVKVQPICRKDKGIKFNAFNNEIEFYKEIAPSLKNFIDESDADIEFDIPEILFAEECDDRAIIILEDLVAAGYRQERDGNGNRYLSKEKIILAVESIAKIHATSYALQNKKHIDLAKDHPMLEKSGMLWTNSEMTNKLSVMKNDFGEHLKKSPQPDRKVLHDRFMKKYDSEDFMKKLCIDRCSSDKETILCLQQGDFHFNNLMFKEEEGKLKVKIIDWQMTYNGKFTGDLTYLIMSSLDPEDFEKEEENIKKKYHEAFQKTLKALHHCDDSVGDTDEDISQVDELFEIEYDKSLPLGFLFSCGNVMQNDNFNNDDKKITFSYQLCKEAVIKDLI